MRKRALNILKQFKEGLPTWIKMLKHWICFSELWI